MKFGDKLLRKVQENSGSIPNSNFFDDTSILVALRASIPRHRRWIHSGESDETSFSISKRKPR